MKLLKSIQEYSTVIFTLLGVLFGGILMTFVFGLLGPSAAGLDANDTAYTASLAIQNDSLNAIQAYSSQSSTQFTTVGLAITLLILIGLFLVFWNSFVKKEGKKSGSSGGSNFM